METSPLLVKGCSALRAFEQEDIFILPHLLWHGASSYFGLIRRTAPFSRLLRHTSGREKTILTQILTGNEIYNIHHNTWNIQYTILSVNF
jgi:hypothetical protein